MTESDTAFDERLMDQNLPIRLLLFLSSIVNKLPLLFHRKPRCFGLSLGSIVYPLTTMWFCDVCAFCDMQNSVLLELKLTPRE